jgi:hypothetical protein
VQGPSPQGRDFGAVEGDAAAGRIKETIDETQECRFSRTRTPNNPNHLARRKFQAYVVYRNDVAETLLQAYQA